MLKFLHSLEYKSDAKCINGLIQSINAILLFVDFSFETDPSILSFHASRFNQDPLENMFSKIRANGGFNRHPNAHQVGKIFSKIICLKLVFNTAYSNCENDEEFIINEDWNQLIEDCSSIHDVNFNSQNVDGTNNENNTIEIIENEDITVNLNNNNSSDFLESSSIDENSLRYFLGFCLKRINKCHECSDYFQKQDKLELISSSENFILQKNYNFNESKLYLRAPSDLIYEFSKTWAKVFEKHFFNHPSRNLIRSLIVNEIYKIMEDENFTFPHRECIEKIIKQFVLVLIRFNCNRNFDLLQNKLLEDEKITKEKIKHLEKEKKIVAKKNLREINNK